MIDFAVLPPEVNSARMYAGAGSAPMLSVASAWDRLAAALTSAANSYRAVITELTDGSWRGGSAAAMLAAVEPYLRWMNTTAAQAVQTANQARATVAAYEEAFAGTVPPSVIAANRAALATLLNTNVFGQNTAAIAANQADYSEMWAQDATAM
ncbi:PPE family protein, partial [Mycobacterium sp. THU-M104]|uniref:PPE family protein n=1 Tax=Mycobacterium sp. THU-M104 TaxID=3410515 RepID=UPI003B9A2380